MKDMKLQQQRRQAATQNQAVNSVRDSGVTGNLVKQKTGPMWNEAMKCLVEGSDEKSCAAGEKQNHRGFRGNGVQEGVKRNNVKQEAGPMWNEAVRCRRARREKSCAAI